MSRTVLPWGSWVRESSFGSEAIVATHAEPPRIKTAASRDPVWPRQTSFSQNHSGRLRLGFHFRSC